MSQLDNPAERTTAIHDIGYRHYSGPRLGQGYLLRSLYVDGVRAAFGIGRAARSKIMPWVLFGGMMLTAFIVAVIAATTNSAPTLGYAQFGMSMQVLVVIFAASQAPALVSRDLRHGVMPLYFSRPLRRTGYVLAKLAAMTTALWLFVAAPVLVVYVGALLAKQPFWENTGQLGRGLLAIVLQALVTAVIALTVAAYLPQRGLGVTIVIAVYVVTGIVFAVVTSVVENSSHSDQAGWAVLASPFLLAGAVQHWILRVDSGNPYELPGATGGLVGTAVLIAVGLACWAALQRRYRKAV